MGPKSPKIVPGDSVPHLAGMESPGTIFAGFGSKNGYHFLGCIRAHWWGLMCPPLKGVQESEVVPHAVY